jgi:GNAT superfamily N-acetyltransferase
MTITRDILVDAIESFYSFWPEIPGRIEYLPIPGIRACVTPLSHEFVNVVSKATLGPDDADDVVKAAYDFYVAREKAFGWAMGPLATPADLGSRLNTAGIVKGGESAGMVLTNLETPIKSNPSVRIRKANNDDVEAMSKVMAQGFPMPEDVSHFFSEVWMLYFDQLKSSTYLAFLADIDEPVACSLMFQVPDQPIVMMSGAATLQEHRGKGIYSSFVARRLADARKEGAEAAAILAMRSTSAPICRKLGFKEICRYEHYSWKPE